MKKVVLFFVLASICSLARALEPVQLNKPDKHRGTPVMEALNNRRSTKECADKMLNLQDLSDLVWAANGINRPASGKRTAPSAMNRQDVKVYVCTEDGSYLYNPQTHVLDPISAGDARPAEAPVCLVLVTDANETWSAIDAGIVSQNISLFCAGANLATYPRATMNKEVLKNALKLTGTQTLMLCHPVGYFR